MAVVVAREEDRKSSSRSEFCLDLGILNNMPDAALERTEQQFFSLLSAAAQHLLVRVRFFSLATLERGASGREHLARHGYAPAAGIADARLDALIVTGTEPRESDLRAESYWGELAGVFDLVLREGPPTLFSCLAAHAAVFHYDGVARRPLQQKRFGVFDHVVSRRDSVTIGLSSPFRIAHSRWNELAESDLAAGGYRLLTWSADAGVELFRKRGPRDLLFGQGHPEYEPATLAREYRRDVRRWLRGETAGYPRVPENYFSADENAALEQFRTRAEFVRHESLMAVFPNVGRRPDPRWNAPGIAIARGWLDTIVEKRRDRQLVQSVAVSDRTIEAA